MVRRLLRVLLFASLVSALFVRGARKLVEWTPLRRGYSLSVKVSKMDDRIDDEDADSKGRLKRTLSEIFLARKSAARKDVAPLGHSLISAVTSSFLGCIAPLATEVERREEKRESAAINSQDPGTHSVAEAEDTFSERAARGGGVIPEADLPEGVERLYNTRATPPDAVVSRAATPPPMCRLPPASVGAAAVGGNGSCRLALAGSCRAGPPGLVDGAGLAGELELRVGAIIEAFATTRPVVEVLGPSLILFLKNDEGNVRKLRKAWSRQIEAETHSRCASLRGLLETEKASGIHKPGGMLADPSAAMALLWMRRSLQFLVHMLHELCEPGIPVSSAMRAAYDAHFEPYHGWVLKQAYQVALNGVPKREDALRKFFPRVQPRERHQVYELEARECVLVLSRVVDAMRTLFEELDLEDVRKAPWI